MVLSSCSPKFGRIITNNSQVSSNLIYYKPELDDTVMKNNKQESLIFKPVTNAPTRTMPPSIMKESNTKPAITEKNSGFIYQSQYRPEIIKPKAATPICTATAPIFENKFYDQDNQLTYITLGLLPLGFLVGRLVKILFC